MRLESVAPDADALIRRTLNTWWGEAQLARIDIRADVDFDGDPVIYIDVDHIYDPDPLDTGARFGMLTELRDALMELGEFRFPHVRHHFDERQEILTARMKRRAARVSKPAPDRATPG